jgi:hypothetical protein
MSEKISFPKMDKSETTETWKRVEEGINQEERKKAWEISEEQFRKIIKESLSQGGDVFMDSFEKIEEILSQGAEEQGEESATNEQETLIKLAEKLISLRWKNLSESLKKYKNIQDEIIFNKMLINKIVTAVKNNDKRVISTRNVYADKLIEIVEKLEREQRELKQATTPEAYTGINLLEAKKQIEKARQGRMIETNYVKGVKKEVIEEMKNGEPVFIHGHLGGGKSDFAADVCIDRMVELCVQRQIDEWQETNKKASKKEIIKKYHKIRKEFEERIKEKDKKTLEKVLPFIVSGSKDFSLQDLYTEKMLKVVKLNGETIVDHNNNIKKEIAENFKKHQKEWSKLSIEERAKKEADEARRIEKLYIMKKGGGYGTEVEKIEKELLRAIKEGKPIIIDEVNAIPPTLLISMNDILVRKPGELAYIPGVGPKEIKEGFSVIMTGNLTSSLTEYFGTEEINPAFLSRLQVREYNYLPQNKAGSFYEQENPEKNELFQAILIFLADKKGSLSLPEGSLDKLFKLSQLAKITQDVFSGKWEESDMANTKSGDESMEPRLTKSILSIRNVINVLKKWNKGEKMDLDMALWKSFISNAIDPQDQNYILNKAKECGFFMEKDGWKIDIGDDSRALTTLDDIRTREYKYTIPKNYTYSPRDFVEILYGKAPERINYPDIDLNAFSDEREIDMEEIGKLETFEEEIEKYEKGFQLAMVKERCL